MNNIVTRQEQIEQGLIRPAKNFVAPEVMPKMRNVPSVIVDPYAAGNASPVQYIVKHDVTPESRARAMAYKTHQVSIFLALMTGALMYALQLYPLSWHGIAIFMLWLALASIEWLAAFALLAVLDWRETPSALEWKRTDGYLHLMKREQNARLMTMYGLTVDQMKELDK
jgi:hypothetical protein